MSVATAGQALCRVIGKQQLHHGLAGVDHTGCVGAHHHAFRTFLLARGSEVATTFNLHHADAAGTGVVLKI